MMKNPIQIIAMLVMALAVTAGQVAAQTYQTKVSSYGLALPKNNVTVRANIDSHIKHIVVAEGQFVTKGDVLVELECDSALAKREIARLAANETGAKMTAIAELKYAKSNFEKVSSLFHKNAVNDKEFREAQLRLERAQAQFKTAEEFLAANQAKLKLAEAELEDHFLRAPFDGQVVELQVSPGSAINSDTDLVRIISSNALRVELYMGLTESEKYGVGDVCPLKAQEPFNNASMQGTIIYRSPIIEATTGTRRVTIEIDNTDLQFPAGFMVSILE